MITLKTDKLITDYRDKTSYQVGNSYTSNSFGKLLTLAHRKYTKGKPVDDIDRSFPSISPATISSDSVT